MDTGTETPPAALEPDYVSGAAMPPAVSRFEFMPGWLAYGPVVAQWLLLGLWHRDLSLPTAANPRIGTGGLCGERKTEFLDLAGPLARTFIAPYTTLLTGTKDFARALDSMEQAGISMPVVVKPEIGCNGTGVRLARHETALREALAAFPRGVDLMLQQFVPAPGEAGIFYIRHPGEPAGRITSLTLKYPPEVVGNGRHTLAMLIRADARHSKLRHLYEPRLADRLADIPEAGQRVPLVFAGNHCKGSIFRDAAGSVTPALSARIDAIARDIPDFHFGRFDVRYETEDALAGGEGLTIIEINGVGSEATHIWDPSATLGRIWLDQMHHYGAAWSIAAALRRGGARSSGLRRMYVDWRRQKRLMASYPLND